VSPIRLGLQLFLRVYLTIINQYHQCYQGLQSDSAINISEILVQSILTTEY